MARVEQYVDSHVAVVTLADGARGNLLGPEMLEELASAISRSCSAPDVRAILLRSNGPDFCLGMDLARLTDPGGDISGVEAEKAIALYATILGNIFAARLPVVCFVQGETKAGGLGLVCASDIVLAAEGAGFELGEVLFGLLPANVLPYLLAMRVSPQKVRYLVMSSQRITAAEAQRLNIVDEVLAPEILEKRVKQVLKRLLWSSPDALAEAKSFSAQLIGKPLEEAAQFGMKKLLEMLREPAMLAGLRAFQEGETPPWFSRFVPRNPLTLPEKKA